MTFDHRITRGHLLRHIPPNSMIGVDVATLDVAQDFLLAHLHAAGMFDLVVFKGGTALRKLFAGTAGRFSTDIDLAIATPDEDRRTVADLVAETIDDASAGPFRYRVENRRGRWLIHVARGEPCREGRPPQPSGGRTRRLRSGVGCDNDSVLGH